MKKALALGVVIGMLPALTLATGSHPMAGCGLGYLLFANKDNTKATQVLGATTNGTFGSQTFGITSGTSGCTEDGAVKFVKEAEIFAEVNDATLRREMAAGRGEFVTAFATLLGAGELQRPALVSFMQSQYSDLYPTSQTSSAQMLQRLGTRLNQHPELIG